MTAAVNYCNYWNEITIEWAHEKKPNKQHPRFLQLGETPKGSESEATNESVGLLISHTAWKTSSASTADPLQSHKNWRATRKTLWFCLCAKDRKKVCASTALENSSDFKPFLFLCNQVSWKGWHSFMKHVNFSWLILRLFNQTARTNQQPHIKQESCLYWYTLIMIPQQSHQSY